MKVMIIVDVPEDDFYADPHSTTVTMSGKPVVPLSVASEGVMEGVSPILVDEDFLAGRFDTVRRRYPSFR